ncbi:MAG: hypothetical protein CTY20_04345 [Hyphomicrobium sp.]|nr:MAG: hypothetical protein CTY20_04345 [Hyphomicrobium sp.]
MDTREQHRDGGAGIALDAASETRQNAAAIGKGAGVLLTVLLLACLIALALIAWARSGLPGLEAPDRYFYDLRHVWLAKAPPTARPEIAIVAVTDRSIASYPAMQPIDRGLLARLVTELQSAGARAIGLDLRFDRATEPAKDEALAAAIRGAGGRVVIGAIDARSGAPAEGLAFQREFLARAGNPRSGHLYFDRKKQGFGQPDLAVRFIARRTTSETELQTSFGEALLEAAGIAASDVGQTVVAKNGEVGPHIAWLAPKAADGSDTFTRIEVPPAGSGSGAAEPIIPKSLQPALANRIVIVGGAFQDFDRHLTPFSAWDGARMTAAEVHAHITAQLMDGRRLTGLDWRQELILLAAIAFVGLALGYWRRMQGGLGDYALLTVILVLVGGTAFSLYSVVLPSDTMFYAALASIIIGHNGVRWTRSILRGRMPTVR